jgi:L-iditol 2-dehydrogenase
MEQGLRLAARGGTMLIFAPPPPEARLAVSPHDILFYELTITGTYSTVPGETRLALDLLQDGRVKVEELITHRLGLAEVKRGLDMTREATESIKVLIEL